MNSYLLTIAIIWLLVLVAFCIIMAVRGPRIADRMMCVNIGTTIISAVIILLTLMSGETYFIDIALIYVILSFMAVVVFVRVYLGIYRRHKSLEKKDDK